MAPSDQDLRREYDELVRELQRHNRAYYLENAPLISDFEYDRIYRRLVELEQQYPDLARGYSPTQIVGATPSSSFPKVVREVPMLSLDNTYNEEELLAFDDRVRRGLGDEPAGYSVELKVDGIGIELTYEAGVLVRGATRGDGRIGEDITPNVRTIRGLPGLLDEERDVVVRGEIYLEREALEQMNASRAERGLELYKNPRNVAGGTLKLLDSRQVASRPLKIVLYEVVDPWVETQEAMLHSIGALGLPVSSYSVRVDSIKDVVESCHAWEGRKRELPFDVDGMVIKIDSFEQRRQLGSTAKYPRWAIAFKFAAERAETVVREVGAQVGRTGAVTPVANLDPVFLSGTTVKRASVHNWDEVERKDLHVGDRVVVEKAGEIIPQIVAVLVDARPEDATPVSTPTTCPECNTPLEREEGEVALRCPNRFGCSAQRKAAVEFFGHRSAMDIDHLGEKLIAELVDRDLVGDVADLYRLQLDDLLPLPRMAQKSAENVLAAVARSRERASLTRLITGIGIPLVGGVAARSIARHFENLSALLAAAPEALPEQLEKIDGVGPKIAQSVGAFLSDQHNRAVLSKLIEVGVDPSSEEYGQKEPSGGPLAGKSFVITGTLSAPRSSFKKRIQAAGGKVAGSVSGSTDYLVAGERTGKSKLSAAEKHDVEVIDEAGLMSLLGED